MSDGDTARETVGPDSHRDPEAWCSRTGTLQARTAEAWCSRTGTFQAQIPSTAFNGLAPLAFDPSLEYSTDNVALFWQPPSYFPQWSPSSFVVDGVSYSSTEQYMIAEKARPFKDHRTVEIIMSLPDPSTHKHIGRGVRNFESAVWDRDKQNAVLSGNYAKFLQNPAIKHHLLSTGNKRFAEASPLDPVWCIELRVDDRQANDARQWRGKNCSVRRFLPSAMKFAKARPGWSTRPSFAGSSLPTGMLELTKFRQRRGRAR